MAPRTACARHWVLLLALGSLIAAAAAARPTQQAHTISAQTAGRRGTSTDPSAPPAAEQRSLMTSYFDINRPVVRLLPAAAQGSARPGRTPLQLQLSGAAAVSPYMPAVCPHATGMRHEVVRTWDALKAYAHMFVRVDAINAQAAGASGGTSPRLFPRHCIAAATAADNSAATTSDVDAVIDVAEARGQRDTWAETSPASVLLAPFGQSVAAVADVMGVSYDEGADTLTLRLDLVHHPDTVSEFAPHAKQTLDTDRAHFHFSVPSGVKLDAAGLLQALQQSQYELPGVHVFLKALPCTPSVASLDQSTTGGVTTINGVLSPCDCGTVLFELNGPYTFVEASTNSGSCTRKESPSSVPQADVGRAVQYETAQANNNNYSFFLKIRALGTVQVCVVRLNANVPLERTCLTVTPAPSKLVLAPAKAHRHVGERITLTLLALDSSGAAVPGVPITFAAAGDCDPALSTTSTTTDANGHATASLTAHEPGTVAVVAVATSDSGARLVTPAAHVFFYEEQEEPREREDYGGGSHDSRRHHDGATLAYTETTGLDADSNAERFAAEATKKALAQLPA